MDPSGTRPMSTVVGEVPQWTGIRGPEEDFEAASFRKLPGVHPANRAEASKASGKGSFGLNNAGHVEAMAGTNAHNQGMSQRYWLYENTVNGLGLPYIS